MTTITYEYPSAEGDPYYPIPRPENQALFKRYEALADETEGVTFVGRLATYRYYNMDQIVGQALATFRRIDQKRQQAGPRSPPNRRHRFRSRGKIDADHVSSHDSAADSAERQYRRRLRSPMPIR